MSLTQDHLRRIAHVAHARDLGFVDLVGLAQLDPAQAFRGAVLRGDLSNQDLRGFDLTGAIFQGCDLSGTDLSATTGVTEAMLDSAIWTEATILPFWATGTPPSWAHDWGRDAFGAWVSFRIPFTQVEQRMRWCPPGDFLMGSPPDDPEARDDERPQHRVTLVRGFWMFETVCTEALWTAVTGEPPRLQRGDRFPATGVSWDDAQDFIRRLNTILPGIALGLPSEARWEYACRAGTTTRFSFGDTIGKDQVCYGGGGGPVEVGSLPANPWGLREMHGNVEEWCEDRWHDSYADAPADGTARGGAAYRVLRGGSWFYVARLARSAHREGYAPSDRPGSVGFRCARVQRAEEAEQAAVPSALASRGKSAERPRPQGPTSAAVLRRVGDTADNPLPLIPPTIVRANRVDLTAPVPPKPDWASAIGRDGFGLFTVFTVPDTEVTQRMRWIPPGRFWMGSPDDEPGRFGNEGPRHLVTLEHGFWLFDTPCTQALWHSVMGNNPSYFKTPNRPVDSVSFNDALDFIGKLNSRVDGLDLTLPSEAEWEYACRAGTEDATYAGPITILGENNAPVLDPIAWYGGNSGRDFDLDNGPDVSNWPERQYDDPRAGTRIVGQKAANGWGLYDMLGNVWEWCEDRYHKDYDGAPVNGMPRRDDGGSAAARRVLRGGSWFSDARHARSASRDDPDPSRRHDGLGFRCARVQRAGGAAAKGGEEQASGAERAAATTSPKRTRSKRQAPLPLKRT